MTIEGREAAFANIASIQESMVDLSVPHGNLRPLLGVNAVLKSVVTALDEGATVDDLRRLIEPSLEQDLVSKAEALYFQHREIGKKWADSYREFLRSGDPKKFIYQT